MAVEASRWASGEYTAGERGQECLRSSAAGAFWLLHSKGISLSFSGSTAKGWPPWFKKKGWSTPPGAHASGFRSYRTDTKSPSTNTPVLEYRASMALPSIYVLVHSFMCRRWRARSFISRLEGLITQCDVRWRSWWPLSGGGPDLVRVNLVPKSSPRDLPLCLTRDILAESRSGARRPFSPSCIPGGAKRR
jgi:hypothetical protein